jgi:hypothetical protein
VKIDLEEYIYFRASYGFMGISEDFPNQRSLGLLKTSNLVLEIGIVHKIDEMMNLGLFLNDSSVKRPQQETIESGVSQLVLCFKDCMAFWF